MAEASRIPDPNPPPELARANPGYFRYHPKAARSVIIGLLVIGAIVLAVWVVPVPHTYSLSMRGSDSPLSFPVTRNVTFPTGSEVQGTWSSSCQGDLGFSIFVGTITGASVYGSGGFPAGSHGPISGAFSFRASTDPYVFAFWCTGFANLTASVSGSYTVPLL